MLSRPLFPRPFAAFSGLLLTGLFVSVCTDAATAADPPKVELALSFKPVQPGVDYEIPKRDEFPECRVDAEQNPFGWVVFGPGGQVIRRYVDTNGDNMVDQWRYYRHGLEVYRDIDTNFNNKVDQSRWLHTGGSRWGLDKNEDGRIDEWKILSAEEATREAVDALIAQDDARLRAVLVTKEDLDELGMESNLSKTILEEVSDSGRKMQAVLSKTRAVGRNTKWSRFEGSMPSIVPADANKASQDLFAFENAMAITETGGQPGLVQIGEMIRIGNVWKLTQVPLPIDANTQTIPSTPKIFQPEQSVIAPIGPDAPTPKMQKLLDRLRELDENAPGPSGTGKQLADYNEERADILTQLVQLSPTSDLKEQWLRQMIDGLAAAVQTGDYPQGLKRLAAIEAQFRKSAPKSPLRPYVEYRLLLAEYGNKLRNGDAEKRQEAQSWWLEQLEEFVTNYPQADDTPEALIQLAITQEYNGETEEAREWYGRLAKQYPQTPAGKRASGAIRRLGMEGEPLALSGAKYGGGKLDTRSLRGRVTLVVFWATWCKPCTEDLPQLKALYEKYNKAGFEIVGVNLDSTPEPIRGYLQQYQVPWNHIHEPGGLESAPAQQFGIISVPTMFLIDKSGTVVSKNATVDLLKDELPKLVR